MVLHNMPTTTIQVDTRTRALLASLRAHPRETYDQTINRLMTLVPEGDDEGTYTAEFRAGLFQSLVESALGLGIPHEKAMRLLGLHVDGRSRTAPKHRTAKKR